MKFGLTVLRCVYFSYLFNDKCTYDVRQMFCIQITSKQQSNLNVSK